MPHVTQCDHMTKPYCITLISATAPTEPPQNIKVQSAGPGELMVSWQVSNASSKTFKVQRLLRLTLPK